MELPIAPNPSCCLCHGEGFIHRVVNRQDEVRICTCTVPTETEPESEDDAGIPALYRNADFSNFVVAGEADPRQQVRRMVLDWVAAFPAAAKGGLLLIAPQGRGKTHLAIAALRQILHSPFNPPGGCLYVDYTWLLTDIVAEWRGAGEGRLPRVQACVEAGVLLIDDLGAHPYREWIEDTIDYIIGHRYDHCLPVMITTRLSDQPAGAGAAPVATLAERIGERASSRLIGMCQKIVFPPEVPDYRRVRPGWQ